MVRRGSGRLLPLWCLLAGLVLGAAWGALARLWMRLITTDPPEFTWSGTLFVVGVFAVTGALAGLVHGARRRSWRGRPLLALRLLAVLPLVPLVAGPGAVLAPTLLLGGLALARSGWARWVRALLGLLAVAAVVAVHADLAQDWPHSTARLLAAFALCLVVFGGTAAALAQSFAPTPGATFSRTTVALLLPLPLLAVLVLVGLGTPGGGGVLVVVLAVALVGVVAALVRRRRSGRTAPPAAAAAPADVPAQTERRREAGRTTGVRGP